MLKKDFQTKTGSKLFQTSLKSLKNYYEGFFQYLKNVAKAFIFFSIYYLGALTLTLILISNADDENSLFALLLTVDLSFLIFIVNADDCDYEFFAYEVVLIFA